MEQGYSSHAKGRENSSSSIGSGVGSGVGSSAGGGAGGGVRGRSRSDSGGKRRTWDSCVVM